MTKVYATKGSARLNGTQYNNVYEPGFLKRRKSDAPEDWSRASRKKKAGKPGRVHHATQEQIRETNLALWAQLGE